MKIQRNDVKKWFAKKVYQIICPYIRVIVEKSPISMRISFILYIFGEDVSKIELTKNELIEKMNI